jgi:hypothetical protein
MRGSFKVSDNIERKRKVDVEKLDEGQIESIGEALGKKIGTITDKAAEDVNAIMNIYGIRAKVVIQLLDEKTGNPIT